MERRAVQSSNIKGVGYDEAKKVLEIEFKNGKVYQFEGVPSDMKDKFVKADSRGGFFSTHIRNKFPATEVVA